MPSLSTKGSTRIGEQGAHYIADALAHNSTLTRLFIDGAVAHFSYVCLLLGKKIGERGAKYLATSMKENVGLQVVTLHRSMSTSSQLSICKCLLLGVSQELRDEVKHELDVNKNETLRDSKSKCLADSKKKLM